MATSTSGKRWLWLLLALPMIVTTGGLSQPPTFAAAPLADSAPAILTVTPPPNIQNVALSAAQDGSLAVTFTEPVALSGPALELVCDRSESHILTISGGPSSFSFVSDRPFLPGENCVASIMPDRVSDLDNDDPPDNPSNLYTWSFKTASEPIVINELDAVTLGNHGEFVELFDGGRGNTDLSGLTLVLYGEEEVWVYLTIGLDSHRTDENGYFVIGDSGVPGVDLMFADGALGDGPDAVALYQGQASDFPQHTPIATSVPVDAAVYGQADAQLLALLLPGQPALNEDSTGTAVTVSNQRCPNGGGLPRTSDMFIQNTPSPGASNVCPVDAAPEPIAVQPSPAATKVSVNAHLVIEFSEPVILDTGSIEIACTISGIHTYTVNGGAQIYQFLPHQPFAESETCTVTIFAYKVADVDGQDPPDHPQNNYTWNFYTIAPIAKNILINEVDADTPGVDSAEFIELYDGGVGHTSLNGLSIVFFNGENDTSYRTVELDGHSTDGAGYFLLANSAVSGAEIILPDGILQNGPDAVALVTGNALDYPDGTPVTAIVPYDAFVYSRPAQNDPGLQQMLNPGQPQVDENGRGNADAHSNQRCPNGMGGLRNTAGYRQNFPTPKAANDCITDDPPGVISTFPANGAVGVPFSSIPTFTFNEPVVLGAGALKLSCASDEARAITVTGGQLTFQIHPTLPLPANKICRIQVMAGFISDADSDDPPDHPASDFEWSFTTAATPPNFVLINELDADTPGNDTAEFIELYDGGIGRTDLTGLLLVLYNGNDDLSYQAIDLAGAQTNINGYLVIGNEGVPGAAITLPTGILQNGADAAALYNASKSGFPNGTALHTNGLLDALVYGTADPTDTDLLALLAGGQGQVDEAEHGMADLHSSGRCPNGSGNARHTNTYRAGLPTPGTPNDCIFDEPPAVIEVIPADLATGVDPDTPLEVRFNEDVVLKTGWIQINCEISGAHTATINEGPRDFLLVPSKPFEHGETCDITVFAAKISDVDDDDPPDAPAADYSWSFHIAQPPSQSLVAHFTTNSPLWIGETAVFTNTSHGPGPLSYDWDFGDGRPHSTEAQPHHDYQAPGVYAITLTVTNSLETAVHSAIIEVQPRLIYAPVINVR